jgi:GntR family transcriptional regulator
VIPFRVQFQPGTPIFEQAVYAAKRAMMAGQLRPGDAFPSVRALSRELKINPNTAHKVIATLLADGLLEAQPGIGTVVAELPDATRRERTALLGQQVEELVVEAKRLGIKLDALHEAVDIHWNRLSQDTTDSKATNAPARRRTYDNEP